ncbi:hypothetical protein DFH29DRAFT_786685, partial [Suillus ampliporus]
AFLWMSWQFQHILSLKQSGHDHDPVGALGTMEEELAILCLACPQPGKNLPLVVFCFIQIFILKEYRRIYALFLAMNANFCLCHYNKSSEQANPSLSKGWAYLIEQNGFKDVLDAYDSQVQEKSSCASHNTVNLADTKNSQGLAAIGIG